MTELVTAILVAVFAPIALILAVELLKYLLGEAKE